MTEGGFCKLYKNRGLKTYLGKTANVKTHDPELKEDCLQEARLRISEAPLGQSLSFYQEEGAKAIDACRKREKRYKLKK